MRLRIDLDLDLGMIGKRNVSIRYNYSEGCTDNVPHGDQSVPMTSRPTIHIFSAIIVERGASIDIVEFITDDDLTRLHNMIIDEAHA